MANSDAEYIDLIFREIGKQDAINAAKKVEAAVKGMSDTQLNSYREQSRRAKEFADIQAIEARTAAQNAAARQAAHQRSVQSTSMMITGLNQGIELVRRFTQYWVALGQAMLSVIENNRTMSRELDALRSQADSLTQSFSDGVEEGGHLVETLRGMNDSIDGLNSAASALGEVFDAVFDPVVVTNFTNAILSAVGATSNSVFGLIARLGLAGDAAGLLMGWLQSRGRGGESADIWEANRREEQAAERSNALDAGLQEYLDMNEGIAPGMSGGTNRNNPRPPPRRRGGGGGSSTPRDYLTNEGLLSELEFRAIEARAATLYDDISGYQDALGEGETELANAREAALDKISETEQAYHELRRDIHNEEMEWVDAEKRQRTEQLRWAKTQVEGYSGAFLTVGNAIGSAFGQLAASEEEGSEAAERYAKIQGGIMAAIAFVQSAVEYASGLASIGEHDYVAAASHFAAGIAYDVAGAMAIAQLGGNASPASTGASSGGAYVPEATADARYETSASGPSITINTMGASSARLAQEIRRADRQLSRAGIDSPMQRAGGFSS